MAGKNDKKKALEAEASFFGEEDLDWLADDDSQEEPAPVQEALPVAPPPPPPYVPPPEPEPEPERAAEPEPAPEPTPAAEPEPTPVAEPEPIPVAAAAPVEAVEPEPAPAAEPEPPADPAPAAQPEVQPDQSSETMLPPEPDEPPPPEPALAPLPVAATPEVLEILPERDLPTLDVDPPTLDVDPTSEEREIPPELARPEPIVAEAEWEDDEEDDEEIAFTGDQFDDSEQNEVPLIRTKEPTGRRAATPGAEEHLAFTPPMGDDPPTPHRLRTYQPKGDREAWEEAATTLITEAALADADVAGSYLFEAGSIHRTQLGEPDRAEILLQQAHRAGVENPAILRELADLAAHRGDSRAVVDALVRRAGLLEGRAAAETLLEAARAAQKHLDAKEEATTLLRTASTLVQDDYALLTLHRDLLAELDASDEHVEILAQIATLVGGSIAADMHWERGRLLQRMGRHREAQESFEQALSAQPGHSPSFLALEDAFLNVHDAVSLASLYEREAARDGQLDPAWWYLKAARIYRDAEQHGRADAAFAAAVERGDAQALREHQAWLARAERYPELARAMKLEADTLQPEQGKAFALYRLAHLHERHLDQAEEALDAYREALRVDPDAVPAAEAVGRLLRRTGRHEEHLGALEERLEATEDPNQAVSILLQMAELAEGPLADQERARAAYERILSDVSPGYLLALHGLQRVYTRLGRGADLARIYGQRADLTEDPSQKAWFYYRAGAALQGTTEGDEARDFYRQALEAVPDHAPSLDAYALLLEASGDLAELGRALVSAADATAEDPEKACLYYRAGKALAGSDRDAAVAVLERCLAHSPQFPPAVELLKDLASLGGATEELLLLQRKEAEAAPRRETRHWMLLSASAVASEVSTANPKDDLMAILAKDPGHQGARAAMELHCMRTGDNTGLIKLYQWACSGARTPGERVTLCAQLADLLRRRWDAVGVAEALQQVLDLDGEDRPLRALARVAMALQLWTEAAQLLEPLESTEDRSERARILTRLGNDRDALAVYQDLLGDDESKVVGAIGAARLARKLDDAVARRDAYAVLAETAPAHSQRLAYALWGARLHEAGGEDDEALGRYRLAMELVPDSEAAFDGVRRMLCELGDAAGLQELYSTHRADDLRGLAASLERTDDKPSTAETWRQVADTSAAPLPHLLHLENALVATEDWKGAYDVLARRRDLCQDVEQRAAAEAKLRWILAEKLADTDEAWDLYRKLHEDAPEDREVTEALARIAGARGEVGVAIQYLRELVETSPGPAAAVRTQRRIGEVYEAAGQLAEARQAFLDALDHVPDDTEAIAGLKRLAEAEQNWPALIDVLRREASLVASKVEVLREIATVTEERLGDPGQAVDAWGQLLEEAPRDREALTHVLDLAAGQREWQLFVETGTLLVGLLDDPERTTLLRRMGIACQDELGRDDAVHYFEQAIASTPTDLESAQRLEQLYRQRGEWAGAVRCLILQSDNVDLPTDKVSYLARAAHLEATVRHDREEAARLYAGVLEQDPDHEGALRFQSAYLYEAGHYEEALPVFQRLEPFMSRDQDLDDFDVRMELSSFYYQYGDMLRKSGRLDEAIERYERALELNPAHLPSLRATAPLYTQVGEWRKAERAFRQLLQLTGGQGDRDQVAATYTQLGLVERELANIDKAYKRFHKALEIRPNHLGALKGMALILKDRQEWSNLLNIYNNIIYHATVPQDVVEAYMTKGRILDEEMGRPDKAAQHYERSLAFDANQPIALLRLAELAMREERLHEAGGLSQRGLHLASEPTALRAALLLVWAASRKAVGDDETALQALAQAREIHRLVGEVLGEDALDDLGQVRGAVYDLLPR